MAFRHEVLHIRRQKQRLIDIPGTKILAHSPRLNQTRSELNSDYVSRFIVELVRESLDLKEITGSYVSGLGQPPFDPRMMVCRP